VPDRNLSVAALMHRGYVERYVRNFHAARRTAIKAALASPFSAESHRALGLSLLGPVWPALRRRIKSICGKRMPD